MKKNNGFTVKIISIGVIILLLMIGKLLISSKLEDRQYSSYEACSSISKAAGGPTVLNGIYLAVPFEYTIYTKDEDHNSVSPGDKGTLMISPKKMNVDSDLISEKRNLGIYSYPVFTGSVSLKADFDLVELKIEKGIKYKTDEAYFLLKVSDVSMQSHPKFLINDGEYDTELVGSGIKTNFKYAKGKFHFETDLSVRGAGTFESVVNADETTMNVKCNWNSPGFTEYDYLPVRREITDEGFTATWNIPFGSVDSKYRIGFRLVESVDVYKKLDRAYNYGLLFIVVPFIALFLFELFANVQLHPVQYLLSGAASVVFFLLLLALSEHMNFDHAYFISGAASGTLVSLYIASISRRKKIGFVMAGVFVALYSYLFCSLSSEDFALLIGSLFAFIVIAVLMFFTRKDNLVKMDKKNLREEKKLESSSC